MSWRPPDLQKLDKQISEFADPRLNAPLPENISGELQGFSERKLEQAIGAVLPDEFWQARRRQGQEREKAKMCASIRCSSWSKPAFATDADRGWHENKR
jgi:hypothetical protein